MGAILGPASRPLGSRLRQRAPMDAARTLQGGQGETCRRRHHPPGAAVLAAGGVGADRATHAQFGGGLGLGLGFGLGFWLGRIFVGGPGLGFSFVGGVIAAGL